MNVKIKPEKYLRYLYLPNLFGTTRTKEILHVNPTVIPHREEAKDVVAFVYDYDPSSITEKWHTVAQVWIDDNFRTLCFDPCHDGRDLRCLCDRTRYALLDRAVDIV